MNGLGSAAGSFALSFTATDASGRYRIRELEDWPSGRRLISFHMVIYKRGYVAYRSDRRFSDLGPRRDFAQHNNEVVLERWRSESHLDATEHGRGVDSASLRVVPTHDERNEQPDQDAAVRSRGAGRRREQVFAP